MTTEQLLKLTKTAALSLAFVCGSTALLGCEEDEGIDVDTEGDLGEDMDNMGDDMENDLDDMGNDVERGMDDMGDGMERAGDDMDNAVEEAREDMDNN